MVDRVKERVEKRIAYRMPFLQSLTPYGLPYWHGYTTEVKIPIMGMRATGGILVNEAYHTPEAWERLATFTGDGGYPLSIFPEYLLLEISLDHELGHFVFRQLPERVKTEWTETDRTEEHFAWAFTFWANTVGDMLKPFENDFMNSNLVAFQLIGGLNE